MWVSPLKPKKDKDGSQKQPQPTKELEKFVRPKLTLSKAEAKKLLDRKQELAYQQIEWVQQWLQNAVRERSLPPQLAGGDAYGQLMLFLNPEDALQLLQRLRSDFAKTVPPEKAEDDDFAFLHRLELGAYHEYLPLPQAFSHNSRLPDDDL
jgi:hypothetical protein